MIIAGLPIWVSYVGIPLVLIIVIATLVYDKRNPPPPPRKIVFKKCPGCGHLINEKDIEETSGLR